MTKKIKIIVASMLVCLIISPVLAHEGHNDAFSHDTVDATKVQKIELSSEGEKAIGIKAAPVKVSLLHKYIKTTGQVVADDNQYSDLSVPISGFVTKVFVREGDKVYKGQILALVKSVEATNLLKDLLNQKMTFEKEIMILTKQLEIQKASYEREKILLADGISSKKDYQVADGAYESTKISLEATKNQLDTTLSATKSQLSVMGIGESTVNQTLDSGIIKESLSIIAPIGGIISFRDITVGKAVQPDKKIFSIINLNPIWVIADVHQNQISNVKEGHSVNITSSTGEEIKGYISNIGAIVDSNRRTVPVRIVCDNLEQTLKPGMAVIAKILYGESKELVIIVPDAAIVKDGERSIVYVKYDTYYQPVEVKLGLNDASGVEILEGLYEGDQVVVRGAEQLYSQGLLTAKESNLLKDTNQTNKLFSSNFILGLLAASLATSLVWFLVLKLKTRRNN